MENKNIKLQAIIMQSGSKDKDWIILGKASSQYVQALAQKYINLNDSAQDLSPDGHVVVLSENMPLVSEETVNSLLAEHLEKENVLTSFGDLHLINAELLLECVQKSGISSFSQKDFKTILETLNKGWYKCATYEAADDLRVNPINTPAKLAQATVILRQRVNKKLMDSGIILQDPNNTYIGPDVQIGAGSLIKPNCYLEGNTVIGLNCIIGPATTLSNAKVENEVEISFSVLNDAEVGSYTTVGPFAYIRPGSKIGEHCKIGDFVEVKNCIIGNNTKASHLTYLGDADIGNNINFGCGSVIVNYDGKNKHRTTIDDNVFIGCNTNLVAPVTVENGAYTAAGSTITSNVPQHALAIARARQINKEDWHKK